MASATFPTLSEWQPRRGGSSIKPSTGARPRSKRSAFLCARIWPRSSEPVAASVNARTLAPAERRVPRSRHALSAMTAFERIADERLSRALSEGAPISFRRSYPSQLATLVGAPVLTLLIWEARGLRQPFFWLLLAALWVSWYFYLRSPHKITIEGSLVTVHWWYRRGEAARSSVALALRPSFVSRLFGYDLLVVGEIGSFPVWPAWFLVTAKGVEESCD